MTAAEAAYERACKIWGRRRVSSLQINADGTVYVNLLPSRITDHGRELASDTRARHYVAHQLDRDGHPICHDDCRTLEP